MRGKIDVALDHGDRKEMAADVQMDAAPAEGGPVANLDGVHGRRTAVRHELVERLQSVERTRETVRGDRNPVRRYAQTVPFVSQCEIARIS